MGKDTRALVEQHALGAQARKGLGQLAADRPRPDREQTSGTLGQPEHALVREVRRVSETIDRWNRGTTSCGNDGTAKPERRRAERQLARAPEGPRPEKQIDSQPCQPIRRVVGSE